MNSLTIFDSQILAKSINSTFSSLQRQLYQYSAAQTLDISSAADINELNYISNPTNYKNCVNGNFQKDSWIPSSQQTDNAILCHSPPMSTNVDNSTCPNIASFITTTGCSGCMSTFSLLYNFNTTASVNTYLSSRYTDCPIFNKDLSNIWINFYLIKRNVL